MDDGTDTTYLTSLEEKDTGGAAMMLLPHRDKEMPTKQLSKAVEESEKKESELDKQVGVIKEERSHTLDNERVRTLETQLRIKIDEVNSQRRETEKLRLALLSRGDAPAYPMTCEPHGLAVIFVNGKFDKNPLDKKLELNNRAGAQKDDELFETTFRHLGYTPQVHRNCTSVVMCDIMKEVSSLDHSGYDSLVVCVSSHGNERAIYGSDSVEVSREEFYNSVKSCKTLNGKPKLFFIQACRLRLDSVTADSPDHNQTGVAPPIATPLHPDADMLIANAASATSTAYITPERGSWFAESLKNILTHPQLRYSRPLVQLLQQVNSEVCQKVGVVKLKDGSQSDHVYQCVEVTATLRKAVKFF